MSASSCLQVISWSPCFALLKSAQTNNKKLYMDQWPLTRACLQWPDIDSNFDQEPRASQTCRFDQRQRVHDAHSKFHIHTCAIRIRVCHLLFYSRPSQVQHQTRTSPSQEQSHRSHTSTEGCHRPIHSSPGAATTMAYLLTRPPRPRRGRWRG